MRTRNKFIKKTSLMIRKHLFENKPYEDFDLCYICNAPITYKDSKIILLNEDLLPTCACKKCLKEIKRVKEVLERQFKNQKFKNEREYFTTMNTHLNLWIDIKKGKI